MLNAGKLQRKRLLRKIVLVFHEANVPPSKIESKQSATVNA